MLGGEGWGWGWGWGRGDGPAAWHYDYYHNAQSSRLYGQRQNRYRTVSSHDNEDDSWQRNVDASDQVWMLESGMIITNMEFRAATNDYVHYRLFCQLFSQLRLMRKIFRSSPLTPSGRNISGFLNDWPLNGLATIIIKRLCYIYFIIWYIFW